MSKIARCYAGLTIVLKEIGEVIAAFEYDLTELSKSVEAKQRVQKGAL